MTEISKNSHYIESIQEIIRQIQAALGDSALKSDSKYGNKIPLPDQILNDLKNKIAVLHTYDLAFILETLPINIRLTVWNCIRFDCKGKILLKVSDAVRESLAATMNHEELCSAMKQLNSSEIAALSPHLPQSVMRDIFKSLVIEKREQLRSAMSYPEGAVGSLMDFNSITIRKDATIEAVLRFLRRQNDLPDHTDQLFVVDRDEIFIGTLPLNKLLVNEPEVKVAELMDTDCFTLGPDDKVQQFAQEFERYVFVSVAVIDEDGKLLGRVPVNAMVNFISAKSEKNLVNYLGLLYREDIFASVWKSAKNRWLWLSINLSVAFFASRVIGNFEDSIEEFVALASLLPIVASVACSAGNQTSAIIIQTLAPGFINKNITERLIIKEFSISMVNGIGWGSISGCFAYLVYKNTSLSIVLFAAMLINQLVGTLVGLLTPLALHKTDRDPASFGSTMLISAITTSGGFFVFLWLASTFLMK